MREPVGRLPRTSRLNVDKEFRLLLSRTGPCFMSTSIRAGSLRVRRMDNIFYERGFEGLLLRQLVQN